MEGIKTVRELIDDVYELKSIGTYFDLIFWASEGKIKAEDLAMACKIFLTVYEHANDRKSYGMRSFDFLDSDLPF